MREEAFQEWLRENGSAPRSIGTRLSDARRVEGQFGDLDEAYAADCLDSVVAALTYTAADRAAGKPNASGLAIDGNVYDSLASYKSAINLYRRFADGEGLNRQTDRIRQFVIDRAALERFRAIFLKRFPDFVSFEQRGGYDTEEDAYKRPVIAEAKRLVAVHKDDTDAVLGATLLDLAANKQHNLLGDFRTYERLKVWRAKSGGVIDAAAGALARAQDAPSHAVARFVDATWPNMAEGQTSKPYGDSRIVSTLILALCRPADAIFVRTSPFNATGQALLGRKLYGWNPLTAAEYETTLALTDNIRSVMQRDWGWRPRDLWDVQGFLWSVDHADRHLPDDSTSSAHDREAPAPTNLILYGPPGTGKTFATAAHAVRLCGEAPPADRAALMERYRALSDAGRIEFVTFHQSLAYEEFVEGLRPVQNGEGGAGFELQPTPGLFRRIARRAETSTGPGEATFAVGDRKVFKMSIGEAASAEDAYLFEEAIAGGYTLLGFGDLDWSEAKFADRQAIIDAIHAEDGNDDANAMSGRVQMPHIFRNWMRVGDLIVVSKGNSLFRAIGEITGGYQYVPRDGGGYAHRRAVRWLWIDRAGVPVSEIYAQRFSMRSAYVLTPEDLNIPALERYATSQQDAGGGAPEPFVLVIDEINRANISKVFGELITLLEADKRLGAANELKVRLPYSGELFGVPANLHIIATMNTADRSIALIDKALRRRFTFREMLPDYAVAGMADTVAGAGVSLADLLRAINERIEYLLDREHQIGHAWLLGCTTKPQLDDVMRDKVLPLIAEYFFEDWGRTADVLGGRDDNPFLERIALAPPPGLAAEEPRYRWRVRAAFAPDAYARCIAGA